MNIPFIENGINIKKWIQFPKLNNEKKIRIILVIIIIIYMIINSFYGQAAVHNKVKCFEDLSHKLTKKINNYFLIHTNINFFIKLFFSMLIDLSIIYTLIVWSIYSTNIRLISSGLIYVIVNILIKFIHVQIQPENSAFHFHKIFSVFIIYQKINYSFYPMGIGLFPYFYSLLNNIDAFNKINFYHQKLINGNYFWF